MKKEELAIYETPLIAEFISNKFLQNIMARYIAWKVNKKWERLVKRNERAEWLSKIIR